jgi:hypothetical protein
MSRSMSALADIGTRSRNVGFVPEADIAHAKNAYTAMPIQDMARRPQSRLGLLDLRQDPTVRYR